MNTKMTFQRLEKKYMIHAYQKEQFMNVAQTYLTMDVFGPSTICNIYFDTDDYHLITTSLQKPPYKEKLRLRSYGIAQADSMVYLEIKKKCKGIVNKRRIALTLDAAKAYLIDGILPQDTSQILSEIDYFLSFYQPKPKVFLAYDRIPLIDKGNSDLRITFDEHIRRRYDHLDLAYGDSGTDILAKDMILMEIKVSSAYPLWLTHLLSSLAIYPISFSKYGTVFMEDIVQGGMPLCSPAY